MPTLVKADCIYQIGLLHIASVQCGLDGELHDREYCLKCKDKVKLKEIDKSDCIHKYQKRIGDESFSFCGEPMGDRCVEEDICRYCTAY